MYWNNKHTFGNNFIIQQIPSFHYFTFAFKKDGKKSRHEGDGGKNARRCKLEAREQGTLNIIWIKGTTASDSECCCFSCFSPSPKHLQYHFYQSQFCAFFSCRSEKCFVSFLEANNISLEFWAMTRCSVQMAASQNREESFMSHFFRPNSNFHQRLQLVKFCRNRV